MHYNELNSSCLLAWNKQDEFNSLFKIRLRFISTSACPFSKAVINQITNQKRLQILTNEIASTVLPIVIGRQKQRLNRPSLCITGRWINAHGLNGVHTTWLSKSLNRWPIHTTQLYSCTISCFMDIQNIPYPQIYFLMKINMRDIYRVAMWLCHYFAQKHEQKGNRRKYWRKNNCGGRSKDCLYCKENWRYSVQK